MTNTIDLDEDLLILSICTFNSSCESTNPRSVGFSQSRLETDEKKMSDITDLLSSSLLDAEEDIDPALSTNMIDYRRSHSWTHQTTLNDHYQWQSEENYLRYGTQYRMHSRTKNFNVEHLYLGSKQLSPSDYQTRQSLYNRPVAFEKDSRSWARDLLNNFKKSTSLLKTKSSPIDFTYYFPMLKKSSSFDHHVQYIEHLNECNDYPAYLEYIRENRSQLFFTLTDSIEMIDGLIGTMVSSY